MPANLISQLITNAVNPTAAAQTPEMVALQNRGYINGAAQDVDLPHSIIDPNNPIAAVAQTQGAANYQHDNSAINFRTGGQALGDTANSFFTGLLTTPVEMANVPIQAISPTAGAAVSRFIQHGIDNAESKKSDELHDDERTWQARNGLTSDYHRNQEQEDINNGESPFTSGLKRIGRDFLSSLANSDSAILTDQGANAMGSIATVGPIEKGLALAGRAALKGAMEAGAVGFGGARRALQIGGKIGTPLTIGTQQAAGIDQNTASSILSMSPEELAAHSQSYQDAINAGMSDEDARNLVARNAGLTAGALSLPVAAVAGELRVPFVRAPFSPGSAGEAIGNILKSGADGAVFGVDGTVAGNAANKMFVNPNQDMEAGVGDSAAQGAAIGLGMTGATQIPGLAFHTALNTAASPVKFASKFFNDRYNKVLADTDAKSPLSATNLNEANASMSTALDHPEIQQSVQHAVDSISDPEHQDNATQYVQNVINRIKLQNGDLEHPVPAIQEALKGSTDRLDAMRRVATLASDPEANQGDRIAAGEYIQDQLRQHGDVTSSDLRNAIGEIPADHPIQPVLKGMQDILANAKNHPELSKAVEATKDLPVNSEISDPESPEGQRDINNIVSRAETNPESLDGPTIDRVLGHADSGKITLSPEQKGALETAQAMLSLAQQRQEAFDQLKMRGRYVSKEIRTGAPEDATKGLSAVEHMKGIVSAMKSGNVELAKAKLNDLRNFATHMQNKVSALNDAFEGDHKTPETGVPYQSLREGTQKWMRAKPENWMYLDPERPSNIANAQRINIDAKTVTGYANAVHAAYPELGGKALSHVELDSRLTAEPAKELADKFKQQGIGERKIPSVPEGVGEPVNSTSQEKTEAVAASARVENTDTAPTKPDHASKVESEPSSANAGETKEFPQDVKKATEAAPEAVEIAKDRGNDAKSEPTEQPSKEAETSTKTEETSSRSDREAEPTSETVEPTNTTGRSTDSVEAAYPELIKNAAAKVVNWLQKNFTFPKEQRSRIVGDPEPIKNIRTAINAGKNVIENFIDGDLGKKLEPEVSKGFDKLIGSTGKAYLAIQDNLEAALNKKLGGKKLISDALTEGNGEYYPVNTMKQFKALNIVEKGADGKLKYNETLLQSALLAGTHWLVTSAQSGRHYDAETLSDMLGVDPLTAARYVDWFNDSHYRADGIESLASNIERFWGIQAKKDAPIGLTRGITEAMAKEVIRGLTEAGLIKEDAEPLKVISYDGDGKALTTSYSRILPTVDPKIMEQIKSFPDLLDRMISINPEPVDYVNQRPTMQDPYQMGNGRLVKNTRQQMKLIENSQDIPFHMERNMTGFLLNLGKDLAIKMFGYDTSNPDLNVNHLQSLEGYNRTITSAYDYIESLDAQTRAVNANAPHEVPIHYDFKMSRVGRLFMQGKQNPQSNKLVRAMVLPTRTKLDLTDPTHYNHFLLAAGQHLGLKVHRLGVEETVNKMNVMLSDLVSGVSDKYQKSFDILNDWASQNDDEPIKLNADHVATFNEEFGDDLTPEAFHAMVELARVANDPSSKEFDTSLYLEADGVTDGPINSLIHLSTGGFSSHWLEMMHKGGLFVGSGVRTLADYVTSNIGKKPSDDLYSVTSKGTSNILGRTLADPNQDPAVQGQRQAMLRSMSGLFGSDLQFDETTNKLHIDRGIVKNPLTVTVYGSGTKGIASKILGEITDRVYKSISENKLTPDMIQDLRSLVDNVAYVHLNGDSELIDEAHHINGQYANPIVADKNFTFSREQLNNLRKNINNLFVRPLNTSIDQTMGDVNAGKRAIQSAIQLQSVFIQHEFRAGIQKAMEDKAAADPKWSAQIGLSQAELDKIHSDAVDKWHGLIKTPTQTFYPAGNSNADVSAPATDDIQDANKRRDAKGKVEISRSLDDKMATNLRIDGPGDAGVKGIPYLVIGSGDGQMVQHAFTGDKALERSLSVFDGINTPLDKIQEYGQRINEAVFKGWTGNDPMRATADSFRAFADAVEKNELPDFSQKSKESIARTLGMPDAKNKDLMVKLIRDHADNLDDLALQNRAMKNVLEKVNLSIDHMASAEAPFTREGKLDVTGDLEQTAAQLHDMYTEEYNRLKDETSTFDRPVAKEATDETPIQETNSPVRTVDGKGLPDFVKSLNLSADQKSIMDPITRFLSKTSHKLVIGSLDQIKEHAINNGDRFPDQYDAVHGYYSDRTKTTYIIDNGHENSETVLHEMIHAATLNKVFQYYNGNEHLLAPHEREAIQRIEGLMDQFYADSMSKRGDPDENAAVETMLNQIETEDDGTAEGKTSALNEFMSWSLSNQSLIERGKKSTVWNRAAKVIGDTIAHIKNLLWGKNAPQVGEDAFSNLRFNTRILLGSDLPNTTERMQGVVAHQSSFFGDNDRITQLREDMFQKLSAWRDKAGTPVEEHLRQNRIDEALTQADGLMHSVDARGWRLTPQELSTGRMLTAAFMVDMNHNPNTMTRLQTIFAHTMKQLTPEHFMNGDADDLNDQYWAREKYKVITGGEGTTLDAKGRSSLLPVFLSLAMVSDDFRETLSKIEPPHGDKSEATGLDGLLNNLGSASLSRLETMLSGEKILSRNLQESVDGLMSKIMVIGENDHSVISQFANAVGDAEDRTNNYIRDAFQALYNKGVDKLDKAIDQTDNKYGKAALAVSRNILAVASNEHAGDVAEGTQAMVNRLKIWKPMQEIVSEFIQRTDSNAPIYDMIKHTKAIIAAIRQQFREHLPKVIAKQFSRKLTLDEYTHMHEAMLKTDAASLTDLNSDQRMKVYSDPEFRKAQIEKYENAIRESQPENADTLLKKSAELADYMNTGNVKNKGNLLKNAYAIAHMLNERLQRKANPTSEIISQIDHLTSLYAIDGISDAAKETMTKLVKDEAKGISFAHNYLVGQRVDEMSKALATGRGMFNHIKGYVSRQNIEGRSLIVANDKDFTRLNQMGYIRAGDYTGSNAEVTGKMGYYYAKASGKSPFLQGIMQNVRQTAYGVDPRSGFSHGPLTAGRIDDASEVARIKKARLLNANSDNPLTPVFDADGSIIAYERSVDPFQENKIKQPDHLARSLGQWKGRQMEESMAQAVNGELVTKLHKMWDNDPEKENYIDLLDPREQKKDGVIRDAVSLFTPDTFRTIRSVYDGEHFWVRKDLVNNTIGYRAPSVGDLWTGISRLDPKVRNAAVTVATGVLGINAYKWLRNVENFYQAQVAEAKTTIIVRSVVVPLMNTLADVVQLASRGVPLQHIVKGYAKKTVELNNYVKGKLRIDEIEAELRNTTDDPATSRRLVAERLGIQDDFKRMSIWPLIDSGQFSVISTGLTHNSAELTPGAFSLDAWVEHQISKMPEPVKTLARYGVVARDTALFQGMERAVEFSDFLGRAVLFDHLKREGKSDVDALANVTQEFVNYDYLPGRTRTALERYGLTWFWNYKIRSTKVALNILRNNPLHMLMAGMMPFPHTLGTIGNPLKDNFASMLVNGRLHHSIGPEMMIEAGRLNPWGHIFGVWVPDI